MFSSTYQISNDLKDAFFGAINALLRPLQHDLVALDPCAREADNDPAKLLRNLPQHLTTPGHKVTVVLRVNAQFTLDDVILPHNSHIRVYIYNISTDRLHLLTPHFTTIHLLKFLNMDIKRTFANLA